MEPSPNTTSGEQPILPQLSHIPDPAAPADEPGFVASIARPLTLLFLIIGLFGSIVWSLAIVESSRTHTPLIYTMLSMGLGQNTAASLTQRISPERYNPSLISYPTPTPTPFIPRLITRVALNPNPTPTPQRKTDQPPAAATPTPLALRSPPSAGAVGTPTPSPTPAIIHSIDVIEGNAYTMPPGACTNPLTYNIGTMDDRFGISKDDFAKDIQAAADVWDVPLQKTLFAPDPNGMITVNLVYDDRQPLVSAMNDLEHKLSADSATITAEKQRFETLKTTYDQQLSAYNDAIATRTLPYDQIQTMYNDLTVLQTTLKDLVATINTNVGTYNNEVAAYNSTRDRLAALFAATPYAGIYSVGSRTISIYIDRTQNEFIHTIAHELGHAIGLGHNNNANAIMYPDTNASLTLSTEDTVAIKARCSL